MVLASQVYRALGHVSRVARRSGVLHGLTLRLALEVGVAYCLLTKLIYCLDEAIKLLDGVQQLLWRLAWMGQDGRDMFAKARWAQREGVDGAHRAFFVDDVALVEGKEHLYQAGGTAEERAADVKNIATRR